MKNLQKIAKLFMCFIAVLSFFNCQDEDRFTEPQSSTKTENLSLFLGQFFDTSTLDIEVLRSGEKIEEGKESYRTTNTVSNPYEIEFDSRSEEGLMEVNSYFVHEDVSRNNTSVLTSYVKLKNELGFDSNYYVTLEKLDSKNYKILNVGALDNEGLSKSDYTGTFNRGWFSRFGSCIGSVISTDNFTGRAVSLLGLAGGVGCAACGIAAAVIVGFGALGCSAVRAEIAVEQPEPEPGTLAYYVLYGERKIAEEIPVKIEGETFNVPLFDFYN